MYLKQFLPNSGKPSCLGLCRSGLRCGFLCFATAIVWCGHSLLSTVSDIHMMEYTSQMAKLFTCLFPLLNHEFLAERALILFTYLSVETHHDFQQKRYVSTTTKITAKNTRVLTYETKMLSNKSYSYEKTFPSLTSTISQRSRQIHQVPPLLRCYSF